MKKLPNCPEEDQSRSNPKKDFQGGNVRNQTVISWLVVILYSSSAKEINMYYINK